MFSHVESELYALVTGELAAPRRVTVEGHVRECARCRRSLEATIATLTTLSPLLPAALPDGSLRERLFASVGRLERFAGVAPVLAELLDTDAHSARRLLHHLDDAERWPTGPLHGWRFLRLESALGPRRAGAMAMFSRFEPGFRFPAHCHDGDESILIFEGEIDDGRGRRGAGALVQSCSGSCHDLRVPEGDVACLCCVFNQSGIKLV